MASLQVRHQRSCSRYGGEWRPAATAKSAAGCTCDPAFYVVSRVAGKLDRQRVGHDPRAAKRALAAIQVEQDRGEYQPLANISFEQWADQWIESLRRPKTSTLKSYRPTMDYAKSAFGGKTVRSLTARDVDRFLQLIAEHGSSSSTQAKHLRVLRACLQAAVRRGFAGRNPVASMGAEERPKAEKREAAYFVNGELAKIMAAAREWDRPLFRLAFLTGMREGELVALIWGDVDLTARVVRVRRQYTPGVGLETPKSRTSSRDVDLNEPAVRMLGELWGEQSRPQDDVLVFPSSRGGFRDPAGLTKAFYRAMKRGGIERIGPTGVLRTFHSTRHTFAKIALESGASIHWLQRQLGHASLQITADVYGHFETEARKRESAKLDEAFQL
jgi:integrase